MNSTRPPFARTTCACPEDVANCKRRPGPLVPSDLAPITDLLIKMGVPPDQVPTLFRATPGATMARITPGPSGADVEFFKVPSISPATIDGSRCIFLMKNDRCLIHAVAPAGCALFDVHQSADEANRRSLWMQREIMNSPAYTAYRATLKEKT
jgi:Fe-S-cluster containining protein